MTEIDIPPCLIFIDKEGKWFHKGLEMIHRDFIKLFYENMTMDNKGRYIISMAGDRCYVEVEDTPFVVWRTEVTNDEQKGNRFFLVLSDDTREELDPETLFVGKEDVLYCRIRDRAYLARFSRPAYYQLASYVEEENGIFSLSVRGHNVPIMTSETNSVEQS